MTVRLGASCLALIMALSASAGRAGVYFETPIPVAGEPSYSSPTGTVLATDGAGTWLAQWRTQAGLLGARSTDGARTWSAPALVDAGGGILSPPESLRAAGSSFVLTWFESGSVYATRSTDGGVTWSSRLAVLGVPGSFRSAFLDGSGTGTWVAGYLTESGAGPSCGVTVSRSTNDAVTFDLPVTVYSSPSFGCASPSLATDGLGTWLLLWSASDTLGGTLPAGQKIFMSRSTDDGATWSPAALVSGAAASISPAVASDGGGRWLVGWQSSDTLGGTLAPGRHLFFSESTDDGGTWSPASAMNPVAGIRPDLDFEQPTGLASDGDATWVLHTALGTVARSIDDGLTWSSPTLAHGSTEQAGDPVYFVAANVAADGMIFVAALDRLDLGGGPLTGPVVTIGTQICGAPTPGCRAPVVPGKSKLAIADKSPNTGDRMKWKWLGGAATDLADFGDPLATTDYTVCVYDAVGRALTGTRMPAGGTCAGKPCWRAGATGFLYKAKVSSDSPYGANKLLLKAGANGKAKIVVGAAREGLSAPALGATALPVLVQIRASDTGVCWESSHGALVKETDTKLVVK